MFRTIRIALPALVLLFGGCRLGDNSPPPVEFSPPPTASSTEVERSHVASPEPDFSDPTGPVTLEKAAALALLRHPGLKAYSLERRVAEAHALQAGLRPNPEIGIEIEEFAGRGERSGFDGAETVVTLGQLIELGGKQGKRIRLASLEAELAETAYESKRLDVLKDVTATFASVLAAQERLALTEQLYEVSRAAQAAVAQRVAAGKDSAVEELRASVALSQSLIKRQDAARTLASARFKLASAWGAQAPVFEKAAGDFYDVAAAPSLDEAAGSLADSPDLAQWATAQRQRKAALELERAEGKQDITIHGGVQHFQETDDSSFVVGLSLPIPLFNRNQGGIEAATQRLAKVRQEAKAAEVEIRTRLAVALNRMAGTYDGIGLLRREVLSRAQQAFDAAGEGYRAGKYDYLHVLDAQRTLFEARLQYIDTIERYHLARADVERLTGRSLPATQADHAAHTKGTNQ